MSPNIAMTFNVFRVKGLWPTCSKIQKPFACQTVPSFLTALIIIYYNTDYFCIILYHTSLVYDLAKMYHFNIT